MTPTRFIWLWLRWALLKRLFRRRKKLKFNYFIHIPPIAEGHAAVRESGYRDGIRGRPVGSTKKELTSEEWLDHYMDEK